MNVSASVAVRRVPILWLVAVVLAALIALGGQEPARGADVVGVFMLDAQDYQVLEGTVLVVNVQRVGGGPLDRDIQVKVEMVDGIEDFDYTPGQQSIVFPQGTNPASKQVVFQTLNQNRTFNKVVRVKILAVSGGTIGTPAFGFVTLLGSRVPRVTDVFPSSALEGTWITVRGTGFAGGDGHQQVYCDETPLYADGVYFGNIRVVECRRISDSELSVRVPPGLTSGPAMFDFLGNYTPQVIDLGVRLETDPNHPAPQPPVLSNQNRPHSAFIRAQGVAIHSLTPAEGPALGGNTVTVVGEGFDASTNFFWGTVGVSRTLVSSTQVLAVVPAGVGKVQVTARRGADVSTTTLDTQYTYTHGPIVTSIVPSFGPSVGGTEVTIDGANFIPSSTVTFGGVPAVATIYNSPFRIVAISPPGSSTVDIIVNNGGALSPNTPADDFSYAGPTIKEIIPNFGPPAGGTKIVIRGTNFTTVAKVFFGTTLVPSEFVSPQELKVTTPPANPGAVQVRITTASGQTPDTPAGIFNYTDGPVIENINPSLGPTAGGTAVLITGRNFTTDGTLSVTVNGVKVANVNATSDKQAIILMPPAPEAGPAEIVVITPKGLSPVHAGSTFTYTPSPPVIIAILPDSGPTFGGTEVTILGSGFLGATCPGDGVMFGLVKAAACTVVDGNKIIAITPPYFAGTVIVTVNSPNGTSQLTENFTYKTSDKPPPPPGGPGTSPSNVSYQLSFRWTLLTWAGPDSVDIVSALKGVSSVVASDNISALVLAVYEWDAAKGAWLVFINSAVPGVSDLVTFKQGKVYWIALAVETAVTWNVVTR